MCVQDITSFGRELLTEVTFHAGEYKRTSTEIWAEGKLVSWFPEIDFPFDDIQLEISIVQTMNTTDPEGLKKKPQRSGEEEKFQFLIVVKVIHKYIFEEEPITFPKIIRELKSTKQSRYPVIGGVWQASCRYVTQVDVLDVELFLAFFDMFLEDDEVLESHLLDVVEWSEPQQLVAS